MKFKDYQYQRPNFESYQTDFQTALHQFEAAESIEETKIPLEKLNHLRRNADTMAKLSYIRHSINTKDAFYKKENAYWDNQQPLYDHLHNQFYRALLDSPFQTELRKIFPETLFLLAKDQLRLLDDSVLAYKQEENEWISQYIQLVASADLLFNGRKHTLSELMAYFTSPDRFTRRKAQKVYEGFFIKHEQRFDEIFDHLVTVRTKMARKLGFENYVAYGDIAMNRWSYNREQIRRFRQFILDEVVPQTQRLYKRQAERLGVKDFTYYDLPVFFSEGNPRPTGNAEELVQKAADMYHQLSEQTGQFFEILKEDQLMDLKSRPGKQSGGYCEFIDAYRVPFIFANFNQTSDDVDVLTHETGHAFQVYLSRWINEPELTFPTSDTAEIHSMSMEFLTWPWMNEFFGEKEQQYRFAHLSSALQFLPYGALVDHFQEEVYTHPEWTPRQRKACWRSLEKQYCPEKCYRQSPALERGIYWFRQGHIFEVPFYYIDYTLAQVCAFQFWDRAIIQKDSAYWEDYLAICQIGGTATFLETVRLAHLDSPFDTQAMKAVIQQVMNYLNQQSEEELLR
ncbi:M3 family oligoendopeptidase [Enterococcus florum]|uniref:M3 family oligoendopeptidase n=1 Tax=Enterococcus florum TaxID=2480627 RepID=A0A4P5PGG4_9ENTE|nr:M3 family oligoendopeptidase [Enterococcus florum]GCF95521.1 M3 family oligoendopeptidase [Enterococcus florum]